MISAIGITGDLIRDKMNFNIQKGQKAFFVFEEEAQGEEFLDLLIGMKSPKSGELFFMGQNLRHIRKDKLFEIRKKIAIVFKTGGLINNIRTLENILLPALYHRIADKENLYREAIKLLETFEFKGDYMCKIEELTNLERRIIALVRGLLIKPEIMILEYPFQGISEEQREWLLSKIEKISKNLTLISILSSQREYHFFKGKVN